MDRTQKKATFFALLAAVLYAVNAPVSKLLRVALLLVTAAFDVWGFVLGVLGILALLVTTKPMVGKGYLYPLIPFNGKALRRLLMREPISRDNT